MKLFITSLLLFPCLAQAQWDSGTESRLQLNRLDTVSQDNTDPLGWWPFLSVNMGLLDFDGENSAGDGHNLQVKGLLSYYDLGRQFTFEGGFGLQNSEAGDRSTTSGLVEAATRYRWLNRWEAGPLVNFFIGNGDDYGSSNEDLTTFIGANLLYHVPLENGDLLRLGGRWMTDVGIPGEASNIVMFEVHYGLPLGQSSAPAAQRPQPRTDHLARLAFESSEWSGPQLAYSTRQVDPNSSDRRKVSQLAQRLLQQEGLVERIRVIGHADERGSTYANQMLSQARAQSVANALIFAGFPKDRIEVVAAGESRPLISGPTQEAWEKNRRVELEFKGVRDLSQLQSTLQEVGIE